MTDDPFSATASAMEPRERLRLRRTDAGLSIEQLAVRAGMAPSTIRAHENGQNGIRRPAAVKYARALATTPEWLMFGAGPEAADQAANDAAPVARMVPILGQIQAGAYLVIPDEPEPEGFVPFYDPRYNRANVYALRVVGRSMDLHYPDGATVYVVPAVEAGIREGDHVVARRERSGLWETTLKEIVLIDGKMALRPRSSDPAHQDVLRIDDGGAWPEIIAVVVGSYVPATPRTAHVLMGGGM
ncbi:MULTISPECIES: LexA family transcriptional regulator [unclassified Brevundimonas]|uniref:LexA family protein n=1 Tax=unclassified Brevundimonas TaxID=2622653 RepID=UPI0014305F3F|nr:MULTISPECIES: S24 family peptidase [unclassified Brevundimonas]